MPYGSARPNTLYNFHILIPAATSANKDKHIILNHYIAVVSVGNQGRMIESSGK